MTAATRTPVRFWGGPLDGAQRRIAQPIAWCVAGLVRHWYAASGRVDAEGYELWHCYAVSSIFDHHDLEGTELVPMQEPAS